MAGEREPPEGARERDARPAAPGKEDLGKDLPPAGPHADPAPTNPDATLSAGALTEAGEQDVDATSG